MVLLRLFFSSMIDFLFFLFSSVSLLAASWALEVCRPFEGEGTSCWAAMGEVGEDGSSSELASNATARRDPAPRGGVDREAAVVAILGMVMRRAIEGEQNVKKKKKKKTVTLQTKSSHHCSARTKKKNKPADQITIEVGH